MVPELHTHIVERPEGLDYPIKFKQIYGFADNDCDDAIKSFTDAGFEVIYTAKTTIVHEGKTGGLARGVNNIVDNSNMNGSLDTNSLDKLLKVNRTQENAEKWGKVIREVGRGEPEDGVYKLPGYDHDGNPQEDDPDCC
jgi:hypothetical protein